MGSRLAISILILFTNLSVSFAGEWQSKIAPEVLAELETGAQIEVIVAFHEQADLRPAARIKGKANKGHFVFRQLKNVSDRSQSMVRDYLQTNLFSFKSFRIVNALVTTIDLPTARWIAQRDEVANIQPNPWSVLDRPTMDLSMNNGARGVIEWGVQRINADDVWNLGFRGEGVIIGGQDTGYEWHNSTIINQYKGWNGMDTDHNYNWHDAIHEINPLHGDSLVSPSNNPCGLDSNIPCDDHNHGTHTMGTMVGDDGAENQIGVAPAAQWIGCRNMERGWGSPASYIECFDWFLAPTDLEGNSPSPEQAPHVINNSWGCPPIEGCQADNFALMEQAITALRAAGVVVVVSAGNSGPSCHSVSSPSAIFEGAFSVGATRPNDTIANFSSRGSVAVDSSFRLKPNIVAPGVQVRSAVRNENFGTWNGTSMAGPHVAGAVALIISAAPHLAGEVDSIEAILEQTAIPMLSEQDCSPYPGMGVPNAVYGYGRIDVFAAVERAMQVVNTNDSDLARIEIFPNPTTTYLWVQQASHAPFQNLHLFSIDGKRIQTFTLKSAMEHLNLRNLPAGIYTYRIGGNANTHTGRIIIK